MVRFRVSVAPGIAGQSGRVWWMGAATVKLLHAVRLGQIDRMVENLRAKATHLRYPEDRAVIDELNRRDGIFE